MTAEELNNRLRYNKATGILTWRDGPRTGKRAGCAAKTARVIRIGSHESPLWYEHHVIWCMVTGEWPRDEVDHRNGNGLDNRWRNLREATSSQQKANRVSIKKDGLPRGVEKAKNQFQARIKVKGKRYYLGLFKIPEEASAAYKAAAEQHFGEFAFHKRGKP